MKFSESIRKAYAFEIELRKAPRNGSRTKKQEYALQVKAANSVGIGRSKYVHGRAVLAFAESNEGNNDLVELMDSTGRVLAAWVEHKKRKRTVERKSSDGSPMVIRLDSNKVKRVRSSARQLKRMLSVPGEQISYVVVREQFSVLEASIADALGED